MSETTAVYHYVVGFAFNPTGTKLLLIQKTHPQWQKGKLNGVGGKIEQGELPIEAIVREFHEEAGLITRQEDWLRFCDMQDYKGYMVFFFVAYLEALDNNWGGENYTIPHGLHSEQTEETLHVVHPLWVVESKAMVMPNLPWLIPMALSMPRYEKQQSFMVKEVPKWK